MNVVDIDKLLPDETEFGHSTAMVRGVIAKIEDMYGPYGFRRPLFFPEQRL